MTPIKMDHMAAQINDIHEAIFVQAPGQRPCIMAQLQDHEARIEQQERRVNGVGDIFKKIIIPVIVAGIIAVAGAIVTIKIEKASAQHINQQNHQGP